MTQVWQYPPNFRAINEPVGTMGSVKTASKPCRVKRTEGRKGERYEYSGVNIVTQVFYNIIQVQYNVFMFAAVLVHKYYNPVIHNLYK